MEKGVYTRLFIDNSHYEKFENLPYLDSLAYVVQEYLYTDISEKHCFNLLMDGRIRFCDFMTMAVYFIGASAHDLGKATIKDYLADLHLHNRYQLGYDIIEYTQEGSFAITNASRSLIVSILWATYIYIKTCYLIYKEEKWKGVSQMLYELMLKEWGPDEEDKEEFKDIPAIKRSEEATIMMIRHIRKKMEENDTIEENTENIAEMQKTLTKIEAENKRLSEKIKELEAENEQLRKKNEELEAEIVRLGEQLQQLPQNEESTAPVDEWFTGEYEKLSADKEFTLRERLVFFSTVLSLENNKKYTVASNLATFIGELCNDQNNIGPFFSKMKKPDEASANAKAAKKVADLMKQIIPKEYRNDKHLPINKFIESMKLNFPETEED